MLKNYEVLLNPISKEIWKPQLINMIINPSPNHTLNKVNPYSLYLCFAPFSYCFCIFFLLYNPHWPFVCSSFVNLRTKCKNLASLVFIFGSLCILVLFESLFCSSLFLYFLWLVPYFFPSLFWFLLYLSVFLFLLNYLLIFTLHLHLQMLTLSYILPSGS